MDIHIYISTPREKPYLLKYASCKMACDQADKSSLR